MTKKNNIEQEHHPSTKPLNIVSLLPSITEVLSSLGVANQIVGITHECDYPPEAIKNARVVTTSEIRPYEMTQEEIHKAVCGSLVNGHSLYGINATILKEVRPDFVFTQSLCDVCAVSYPVVLATCARIMGGPPLVEVVDGEKKNNQQLETDSSTGGSINSSSNKLCPKIISMEPESLKDVLKTFHVAGKALGKEKEAEEVVTKMELGFEKIHQVTKDIIHKPKVAFLEWHYPIFTGGHWIPDMLEIANGEYEMCQSGDRSAPMKDEDFIKLDPDVILIGPCGFSLDRSIKDTITMYQEKAWFREMRAVKNNRLYALDGNSYYARPGPRLLQGCGIMAVCMHGEQVAKDLGEELAPSSGYICVTPDMCT